MPTLRFTTEQDYQAFLAARQSRQKNAKQPILDTLTPQVGPKGEDKAVVLLRAIVDAKLPGIWYREFTFHESRGWRIDIACPEPGKKLGVEVDGGVHRIKGKFARDMEKWNAMIIAGWRCIRVTPAQVDSGYALALLKTLLQELKR